MQHRQRRPAPSPVGCPGGAGPAGTSAARRRSPTRRSTRRAPSTATRTGEAREAVYGDRVDAEGRRSSARCTTAMKAGDKVRLGALRLLTAAIKNRENEVACTSSPTTRSARSPAKEVKKRTESIEAFDAAGRDGARRQGAAGARRRSRLRAGAALDDADRRADRRGARRHRRHLAQGDGQGHGRRDGQGQGAGRRHRGAAEGPRAAQRRADDRSAGSRSGRTGTGFRIRARRSAPRSVPDRRS